MQDQKANREAELKQGIIQYIGAAAKDSGLDGDDAAQLAISMVTETSLELGKRDYGYDFYVLKPIIRGAAFLLAEKARQIDEETGGDPTVKKFSDNYRKFSNALKNFADASKQRTAFTEDDE